MQSLGRALDKLTIIKLSLLSPAACVQVQLGGTVSCGLRYRARPDCHCNVHNARLSMLFEALIVVMLFYYSVTFT